MRVQIDDYIEPIFTTYYTMMGRYADQTVWFHIATGDEKEYVEKMAKGLTYDYYKIISFELETYDDELLYKSYYRQKKLERILEDDENINNDENDRR